MPPVEESRRLKCGDGLLVAALSDGGTIRKPVRETGVCRHLRAREGQKDVCHVRPDSPLAHHLKLATPDDGAPFAQLQGPPDARYLTPPRDALFSADQNMHIIDHYHQREAPEHCHIVPIMTCRPSALKVRAQTGEWRRSVSSSLSFSVSSTVMHRGREGELTQLLKAATSSPAQGRGARLSGEVAGGTVEWDLGALPFHIGPDHWPSSYLRGAAPHRAPRLGQVRPQSG